MIARPVTTSSHTPMTFTETRLPGVWLIDADVFPDAAFGIDWPVGAPSSINERGATYPDFVWGK